MVDICCGVVNCGAEAAAMRSAEPGSRGARRRRMEIRRLRFDAESEAPAVEDEPSGKRQRMDGGIAAGSAEKSGSTSGGGSSPQHTVAAPEELDLSDRFPRFGMATVCGRRRDMEDAVSIRPDFVGGDHRIPARHHFFGVFDGHGCSHVASLCKDRMHEVVAEEVETLAPCAGTPSQAWRVAMERSFARMDSEAVDGGGGGGGGGGRPSPDCRCELQPPRCEHVGSTAVVAVIGPTRIVVANCGDSRAVLCRNGAPIPISSDHKPDREDELQRIEAMGGRVIYWDGARVLGVLAMSRAIGDSYLKPYVVSEPEVTVTEREEGDECLILASDGLWDVVSNETACGIARMCLRGGGDDEEEEGGGGGDALCSDAAILLTKLALARQSADNISVVVIDLRSKPKRRRTATATATTTTTWLPCNLDAMIGWWWRKTKERGRGILYLLLLSA
ncbi:probable protein phosphatase 2C 30 isoform X3 [Musa acuminata AAA Group]|uniref:probable protein phosphatase 2C 30 isoform X3 n=1 Tax=Musa acuminata AAA Group TaxID=214697 RepID=UPI0031E1723A